MREVDLASHQMEAIVGSLAKLLDFALLERFTYHRPRFASPKVLACLSRDP